MGEGVAQTGRGDLRIARDMFTYGERDMTAEPP